MIGGGTNYESIGKGMLGCFGVIIGFVIVVAIIIGVVSADHDESSNDASKNISTSSKSATKKQAKEDDISDKEFKIGDTVSYKGYEIKVNKVDYSQGSDTDATPDEGKQYAIVSITITNNTKEKQSYNPYDYSLNTDGN